MTLVFNGGLSAGERKIRLLRGKVEGEEKEGVVERRIQKA